MLIPVSENRAQQKSLLQQVKTWLQFTSAHVCNIDLYHLRPAASCRDGPSQSNWAVAVAVAGVGELEIVFIFDHGRHLGFHDIAHMKKA